jgi:hypothetical protein
LQEEEDGNRHLRSRLHTTATQSSDH